MPRPPNSPLVDSLHLVEVLGLEQHRVRIERREHAVDGRVLDVPPLLGIGELGLQEAKDVPQRHGDFPQLIEPAELECLLALSRPRP